MTRAGLVVVMVIAVVWAARVDVPRLTGKIKGDEATYVSMAFSVAKDRDLKYRPEDFKRFVAMYGTGPEGVFLKQTVIVRMRPHLGWPPIQISRSPVSTDLELDYGKPFAYAIAAAPFAAVFGLGGLLLFNLADTLRLVCGGVLPGENRPDRRDAHRLGFHRGVSRSGLCGVVDAGVVQFHAGVGRIFSLALQGGGPTDRPTMDQATATRLGRRRAAGHRHVFQAALRTADRTARADGARTTAMARRAGHRVPLRRDGALVVWSE
jgi:hypothetical protein